MKKSIKKLTLNRETLRQLTKQETQEVAGGASGDTSCRCKLETGCECATVGCTIYC
ncbi:MAG TPA: class I lanthipeptide [Thermoanaerobaculia bacterium]|nr:class I lanthipeptide [Thermoanaerobaculia bacterium]HSK77061.1 class I lanthipeptide [Thermoanaerobaculia bacterium]